MTTNTVFTTQTVLCEAPYYLVLLYYIHVYNKKEAYLFHITCFSDQNNWLKFSVLVLFTLRPLPNLDYIICGCNRVNMYAGDSADQHCRIY